MPSVYVCHAPDDAGAAAELKKYLEAGTCFEVDCTPLPEGETVTTWYDRGTDFVVLLLSPKAAPPQPRLEEWQGVLGELEQNRLASVVLTPCKKPRRLEAANFFEGWGRAQMRGVKQWLIGRVAQEGGTADLPSPHAGFPVDEPGFEALRCVVGDRAGRARLGGAGGTLAAVAFADRYADDFEQVIWTHCGDGSAVAAASDLAMRLGLRLTGPSEADLEAIERAVRNRRYLLVLDHPAAMLLEETGKSSVLVAGEVEGDYQYEHDYDATDAAAGNGGALLEAISRFPAGLSLRLAGLVTGLEEEAARAGCEALYRDELVLKLGEGRYWAPGRKRGGLELSDVRALMRCLARWRDAEELGNVESALRAVLAGRVSDEAWEAVLGLLSAACSVAKDRGRTAEVHAFIGIVEPAAKLRADMKAQESCLRERQWIEESWGAKTVTAAAAATEAPFQIGLDLLD